MCGCEKIPAVLCSQSLIDVVARLSHRRRPSYIIVQKFTPSVDGIVDESMEKFVFIHKNENWQNHFDEDEKFPHLLFFYGSCLNFVYSELRYLQLRTSMSFAQFFIETFDHLSNTFFAFFRHITSIIWIFFESFLWRKAIIFIVGIEQNAYLIVDVRSIDFLADSCFSSFSTFIPFFFSSRSLAQPELLAVDLAAATCCTFIRMNKNLNYLRLRERWTIFLCFYSLPAHIYFTFRSYSPLNFQSINNYISGLLLWIQ